MVLITLKGSHVTDKTTKIDIIETTAGKDEMMIKSAECFLEAAGENPSERAEAINSISALLFELNDATKVSSFATSLATKYKLSKKVFTDRVKFLTALQKSEQSKKKRTFDEIADEQEDSKRLGWFVEDGCYWFHTSTGYPVNGSNFTIKPLFHIYSKIDNKRLVEITNDKGFTKIIDIPSKNFISVEQFSAYVYAEGNFIWTGTKQQYMKILKHISEDFPVCNELRTLGWQREGFFAFANGIYDGIWQPVDEYGITTYKQLKYFSPAFSVVYSGVREDDDDFENDRYFVYNQAKCTFGQWSKLMLDVYGENAITAIAFAIATTFRDLIYDKYKIFPHLFLFGEKQSGKSQLAWSLSNLFFHNLPAFNLNAGTQVGFFRRLSRVKNAIVWLDEYCNEIDPKRFQALKSAYDGVGHEKGKMTQDSRTMVTKVNGGSCISGQYLPIIDDNSLLTRSCLLNFLKKKYTEEQIKRYDILKKLELEGISSLLADILQFRELIDKGYAMTFSEIMERLKDELNTERLPYDERLVRNYCCLLTPIKIILESDNPLQLNFSFETFFAIAKKSISDMSKQITNSESISTFWKTAEFLLDEGKIIDKVDFKIDSIKGMKITDKDDKVQTLAFSAPVKCLFVRLTKLHSLYLEKHRQQTGKNGVDMASILHYLKSHKSYLGHSDSVRFDTSVSTAYVFKYGPDELNVNLERTIRDAFAPVDSSREETLPPKPIQGKLEIVEEPPF